jgi:hypothetical protein
MKMKIKQLIIEMQMKALKKMKINQLKIKKK